MTTATEQQAAPRTSKLADLQQRLSEEMQRHTAAIAEIQRQIQNETREEARSLVAGDQGSAIETTEVPESREPAAEQKRELTVEQKERLLAVLQHRLSQKANHYERPEGVNFADVKKALEANPVALRSLSRMEETGGAPDIVAVEDNTFVFADCSAESPAGRRNCVYDKAAEAFAYGGTCNGNAVDMAGEFGVEMWSPEFYRKMQEAGKFDRNTWSWLATDEKTRETGGARCGVRRGGRVFVGQDDALSHDGSWAWRGLLRVQKA